MGCCGGDREKGPTKESQKWEYITLNDFKSKSAWNVAAYVWLWIMFISTIVIYAVDTFTAVNLLAFNKWSSQIKPYIPFEVSKWIFAGCILFSWILWGFEWFRAVRVIKRSGVAESYLDPLAVSLQSMRAQGWNRFLVFAELTKSKKGMDLVAFFSYFSFKGAIRILAAEGPRQVINTLTLIAVIKADFVDKPAKSQSGIGLFWFNLNLMWEQDKLQVVIIFSMMYSLFIWVLGMLCLASAAIMYIVFLWHYIPSQDGGLSSFCKRKVDKRLEKIVESKVKAAIEDEERRKRKAEEKDWKAAQKAEKKGRPFDGAGPRAPGIARQPTLPQLDSLDSKKDNDDSMDNYPLRRTDTGTSVNTLPVYASRPGTRNEDRPPLPMYNSERPPPLRTATNASQWTTQSYESDAPLLVNAAQTGESLPTRPPNAFNRQDSNASFGPTAFNRQDSNASFGPPAFNRNDSNASFGPNGYGRAPTPGSQRPYSPAPGMPGQDGRSFSPMSRTDFSQGAAVGGPQYPQQRSESPFGRPMRTESPYGAPRAPTRQGTQASFDRNMPLRAGTATPFDRPGTTNLYHRSGSVAPQDRSGSTAPYERPGTSAPYERAGTANPYDRAPPLNRQPTSSSINSNASFSRPLPPLKTTQPLTRSYTQSSNSSSSDTNSYEMKPNPYISKTPVAETPSAYSAYKAFNPNKSTTPAPAPQRATTATPDYFSHRALPTPSSQGLAAPEVDNRATIGYSDIVDDYGSNHTPGVSPTGSRQTSFDRRV